MGESWREPDWHGRLARFFLPMWNNNEFLFLRGGNSPVQPLPMEGGVKITLFQHTMIFSTTFQQGSSNPIPQKLPPPFGRKSTTIQLICIGISPWSHMVWIILMKILHFFLKLLSSASAILPGFSLATFSSCQMSASHVFTFSAHIPVVLLARPFVNCKTTERISLSVGVPSGISKNGKLKGRGAPWGSPCM